MSSATVPVIAADVAEPEALVAVNNPAGRRACRAGATADDGRSSGGCRQQHEAAWVIGLWGLHFASLVVVAST